MNIEIVRDNERLRSLSNLFSNLGAALLAAGAARCYFEGMDPDGVSWILVAFLLIWLSMKFLTLLAAED